MSRRRALLCDDWGMSPRLTRVPRNPVAVGWMLYGVWRKLPRKQRRQLLDAARTHGPRVASAVAAAAAARAKSKVAKGKVAKGKKQRQG